MKNSGLRTRAVLSLISLLFFGCENMQIQDMLRTASVLDAITVTDGEGNNYDPAADGEGGYSVYVPFAATVVSIRGRLRREGTIRYVLEDGRENSSGTFDFPEGESLLKVLIHAESRYMDPSSYTLAIQRDEDSRLLGLQVWSGSDAVSETESLRRSLDLPYRPKTSSYTVKVPHDTDRVLVKGKIKTDVFIRYGRFNPGDSSPYNYADYQSSGEFSLLSGQKTLIKIALFDQDPSLSGVEPDEIFFVTAARPGKITLVKNRVAFTLEDASYFNHGDVVSFSVSPLFGCEMNNVKLVTGTETILFDKNGFQGDLSEPVLSAFVMPDGDITITGTADEIPAATINAALSPSKVRFVRPGGNLNTTQADGSTWAKASGDLQAMIEKSSPGDEIWISAGSVSPYWAFGESPLPAWYYSPSWNPGLPANREKKDWAFVLKEGVRIYGGFRGTERQLSDKDSRDLIARETVLSGEALTSRHVVIAAGTMTPASLLDGLTIQGGSTVTVSDNLVLNKGGWHYIPALKGAGAYITGGASPWFNRVIFRGNSAALGGGMYVQNSSPLFTNTRFEGNTATGSGGGVFSESNSGPVFVNAHFESNVSSGIFSGGISYDGGGAIHSVSPASALLVNTTIENNRSILGPGGLLGSATDTVYNSVIRNNQGSAPGINNISGIPTGSFRKSLLEGESGGEFLGDSDIPGGGGPEHYPVAPGGALVSTSPAYPVLSALPSAVQDRVTNALTKDINGTGRFNNDNSIGLGAEKQ